MACSMLVYWAAGVGDRGASFLSSHYVLQTGLGHHAFTVYREALAIRVDLVWALSNGPLVWALSNGPCL